MKSWVFQSLKLFVQMKVVWSHTITTQCPYKTRIANQFPQLISRIGRSKIPIVKSKFHKNFQPKHQKGRRVPNNLQDRVNSEIKKLLEIYFSYIIIYQIMKLLWTPYHK